MDEQAGRRSRTDSRDSGDAYEPYVGRWSRLVAREFLGWLAVPPGRRWLDLGCGTGALAESILTLATPGEVVGVNPSAAYVAFARDRLTDTRVRYEVGDAGVDVALLARYYERIADHAVPVANRVVFVVPREKPGSVDA